MAEGEYFTVRLKAGAELPEKPQNGRPGQWPFDSRWYPKEPLKSGKGVVLAEGPAKAGERFFTGGNGETLLELEPYAGPTDPESLTAPKLEYHGVAYEGVEALTEAIRAEISGRADKSSAPLDNTPKPGEAPRVVDSAEEQRRTKAEKHRQFS